MLLELKREINADFVNKKTVKPILDGFKKRDEPNPIVRFI